MALLQAITELEAVNAMLRAIGSSPVSSLEDNGVVDAAMALQTLRTVSRDVQQKGWHFNSEIDYEITPTYPLPGEIILPANCLKVDPVSPWEDCVQRGLRLYDRKRHSFSFENSVKVAMVVLLDFDELPQYARTYIVARATRVYQMSVVGSDTLDSNLKSDELRALQSFKEAEADNADYNILTGDYSVFRILDREGY